jgi:membrane-bound lytic murein transglycosylase B
MTARLAALLLAAFACLSAPSANAARCGGDFNSFIAEISREAQAQGVSQNVIAQALGGVTHDPAVMAFDRRQRGTFRKTFEEYAATRVTPAAHQPRRALMAQAALLPASSSASACRASSSSRSGTMETDNRRRHGQAAGGAHARDAGA